MRALGRPLKQYLWDDTIETDEDNEISGSGFLVTSISKRIYTATWFTIDHQVLPSRILVQDVDYLLWLIGHGDAG